MGSRYRSSETGRAVTKDFAKANPATTVEESAKSYKSALKTSLEALKRIESDAVLDGEDLEVVTKAIKKAEKALFPKSKQTKSKK